MASFTQFSGSYTNTRELMFRLAAMANISSAGICRMVLDLRLDSIPTLYTETRLDREQVHKAELPPVDVNVVRGPIDTTTILNETFRTYEPSPTDPEKEMLIKLLRGLVVNEGSMDDVELRPVRDRLFSLARDYLESHFPKD